jgi:hypothetical protein
MPVVPKSFSYAQKKYPSEARNKSGKRAIRSDSKRRITREKRKAKCAKPPFQ